MDLLHWKAIYCSAKYIKFNEMKNRFFLDALSKSDVRLDRKQDIFLYNQYFKKHYAQPQL